MGTALIIIAAVVVIGVIAYFLIEPNRREREYERELKERLGPEASPHELPEVPAGTAEAETRTNRFERESEQAHLGDEART